MFTVAAIISLDAIWPEMADTLRIMEGLAPKCSYQNTPLSILGQIFKLKVVDDGLVKDVR